MSTPEGRASSGQVRGTAIDNSTASHGRPQNTAAPSQPESAPLAVTRRDRIPPRPDSRAIGEQPAQEGARPRELRTRAPPKPTETGQARAKADHDAAALQKATDKAAREGRPRNEALLSGRYAINTYLFQPGAEYAETSGSILSQSVNKAILANSPNRYAGDLSLGQLRKLTPGMSSFSRIHRFCSSDGTPVIDESISFDDYLALEASDDPSTGKDKEQAEPADDGAKEGDDAEEGESKKTAGATDKTPVAKAATPKAVPTATVPKLSIYFRVPPRIATAGMDLKSVTAPTINLGMRPPPGSGAVGDPNAYAPGGLDANGYPLPAPRPPTAPAPPPLNSVIGADKTFGAIMPGNSAAVTAGNLSEEQWSIVLRNCAVFYGWKVDKLTGLITRAPQAAFRLRSKIEQEPVAKIPVFAVDTEAIKQKKAAAEDADFERSLFDRADVSQDAVAKVQEQNQLSQVAALSEEQRAPDIQDTRFAYSQQVPDAQQSTPLKGIPNFRVNDDSRIEVTACQDSLAVSLAKSDFSSQSTEASVAGGAYGVTVGVSVGIASSKSANSTRKDGKSTQTLVARYMYPRCDIFLRAEDLEPTPELAALLEKAKGGSIDAVRAIHDQYGQLFCQELTLGARLLTTKIITSEEHLSTDEQKEQMKVSVGVSVQTPYGGASVKHEQESGTAETKTKTETSTRESNVFEAVGGDTILANNPAAWANTVSSPNLWRVVNRDDLSSMIDMISQMPKYEAVQMWFVQANAGLQKYIGLNAALSINVRFKVQKPLNSLSVENSGNSVYYLGFDPATTCTPRLNGYESHDIRGFWQRVDVKETHVLFHPASYRAPCLHGFSDFAVGDGPFGSKYNSKFAETQWSLIAPFGDQDKSGTAYELKNGSRVILQTVPFRVTDADGKDKTPPASHMTVFRNAQGVFMPAISDRDEYQYWRIESLNSSVEGEPIKGGDSIRLCWKFSDQITGFRDYMDDVFGRRRNQCPEELASSTLYLKVPWPRFEVRNTPTAMVMSADAGRDVVGARMSTRVGDKDYAVQDVQFRIDTVEKRGEGDSGDYMLAGVRQEMDERTVTVTGPDPVDLAALLPKPAPSPLQILKQIGAFGVFGGLF